MKIIVTGCKGQLGTEMLKQLQEGRSDRPHPRKAAQRHGDPGGSAGAGYLQLQDGG